MAITKYSLNYVIILFKLNHWLDVVEQKGIPCQSTLVEVDVEQGMPFIKSTSQLVVKTKNF